MTENSDEVNHLRLMGETLPIKSQEDNDLLHEAHNLVQERLDSIGENRTISSSLKKALLCSMNLAGELIKLEKIPGKTGLQPETIERIEYLQDQIQKLEERSDHGST